MFARIGMMRVLNHGQPKPVTAPGPKRPEAYGVIK
jgi:hypothetical protein